MSRELVQSSLLAPVKRKSTATLIVASIFSHSSSSNFASVQDPLLMNGKMTFWKLTISPSIHCHVLPMSMAHVQPSLLALGERKSTATVIVAIIFSRTSSSDFVSVNVPLLIKSQKIIGSTG
jgi:hypothetical protein